MLVVRQPQTAAGMPAHVLTGQRLELRIQLIAIGVDLGEIVAAGDVRALTAACQVEPDVSSLFSIRIVSEQPSRAR